jgi:hypothetical protein
MEDFGTCYGHMVHFMVIWYILWSFGICIFPVLVYCTKVKSGNPCSHLFLTDAKKWTDFGCSCKPVFRNSRYVTLRH